MRISVVVANYNCSKYIGQTMRSLLTQSMSHEDYEIIVIDDGSTDLSIRLLEPYMDAIRLFVGDNQGVIAAANEGFRRSRGQYIVRVDADDYVNSDFLKLEAMFLTENKEYDAVSCDYYKVDSKGNWLSRHKANNEPIACGVMFRREAGFYADGSIWNDVEFLKKLNILNIPLPLYRYLQRENSLTHREDK